MANTNLLKSLVKRNEKYFLPEIFYFHFLSPLKFLSTEGIDGAVATIMALDRELKN